jgi:hypothetical protein
MKRPLKILLGAYIAIAFGETQLLIPTPDRIKGASLRRQQQQ